MTGPISQAVMEEVDRYESAVDPRNPWPVGCEWWRAQNEMWRRDRAKQEFKRRIFGQIHAALAAKEKV